MEGIILSSAGSRDFTLPSSQLDHNQSLVSIYVFVCWWKEDSKCCQLWIAQNSISFQCYSVAIASIYQHFVLNSVSQINTNLFKSRYATMF